MQSLTQQFIAFCRSKPAGEAYDFGDPGNCAFSQFLRACGYASDPSCSSAGWRDAANKNEDVGAHPMPTAFATGACADGVLCAFPWTFSALADRLEQSQPVREREPA